MTEQREINGVIHDVCEIIDYRGLAAEGIGRRAGQIWPDEGSMMQPRFFGNVLASQYGWWSPVYFACSRRAARPIGAIDLWATPNASVLGEGGAARLADGRLIDLWVKFLDEVALLGPLVRLSDGQFAARRDGRRPHVAGTHLLGHVGGDRNYAHWLTCALPIWRHFATTFKGTSVKLVLGSLTDFHRGALDALRIGADDILPLPEHEVSFDELIVSTPINLSPVSRVVADAAREIRDRALASHASSDTLQGPPRRLFVARSTESRRRLLNEAAVLKAIEPFGFERVLCETMSFAEQVRLFSKAEIVMAVHGAGLANIAFCRPGAHVIELFSEYNVQPAFRDLAAVCGLPHGHVVGTSLEKIRSRLEMNSWDQPFVVGVPIVVDAVRAAIAGLRDGPASRELGPTG